MKLHNLKPNKGTRDKERNRVGRGMAHGKGKQAGKGQSGQNKRNKHRLGFEGGQNVWFRRLPKVGFKNFNHIKYQTISLTKLDNKYKNGAKIDSQSLITNKLIKNKKLPIKILANGKISKKIEISVHAVSKNARLAIEKAGGKINLI